MSTPKEQVGESLLELSADVYAEVSVHNGRIYASVRRWFRADDGEWYRTKNGLHLRYSDIMEVLACYELLVSFFQQRAAQLSKEQNIELV